MENFKYSEEEARGEASEMKELVGDKGSKEEYDIAAGLIEEYMPAATTEIIEHVTNEEKEDTGIKDIESKKEEINKEDALKKEFENVLKDKFDFIPEGSNFSSNIEGIRRIYIAPSIEKSRKSTQIYVYYDSYNKSGESMVHHTTLYIDNTGHIGGDLPTELKDIDRNDILSEVLVDLKSFNFGKHVELDDMVIIPPGPWVSSRGEKNPPGEKQERVTIDIDRLKFFEGHPELLLSVKPGKLTRIRYGKGGKYGSGINRADLSDYHAFLFPKGAIFENNVCENNIYYYLYEKEILDDVKDITKKILERTISVDEKHSLLGKLGYHIERVKNKTQLKAEGKKYPEQHHKTYIKEINQKLQEIKQIQNQGYNRQIGELQKEINELEQKELKRKEQFHTKLDNFISNNLA